jgi:hypothetical protein
MHAATRTETERRAVALTRSLSANLFFFTTTGNGFLRGPEHHRSFLVVRKLTARLLHPQLWAFKALVRGRWRLMPGTN